MKIIFVSILLFFATILNSKSQQVETYKLQNGVTAILIPESQSNQIHAAVVCRTANTNNPSKTLAFNTIIGQMLAMGTQTLGTNNGEIEMRHYRKILAISNQLDTETDKDKRTILVSQMAIENDSALNYMIHGEPSLLMQSITSRHGIKYQLGSTIFYSTFTPTMLERYLDLTVTQLSDPVFRDFHNQKAVIEAQYIRKLKISNLFDSFIDAREYKISYNQVVEHIKNASLTKVLDYYHQNYGAENIGLVITGNFNANQIKPIIENQLSQLQPAAKSSNLNSALLKKSKKKVSIQGKNSAYGTIYNASIPFSKEFATQQLLAQLITNKRIGILSNYTHKGTLSFGLNNNSGFTYPVFTYSNKRIEKMLLHRLSEIGKGNIEDSLFAGIKQMILNDYTLQLEKKSDKVEIAIAAFLNNENDIVDFARNVSNTNVKEVQEMANAWVQQHKRLKCDKIKLKDKSDENIKKPIIETNTRSLYTHHFDSIPAALYKPNSIDFASVSDSLIAKGVKLKHCLNTDNDLFTLKFTFSPTYKITTLLNKTGNAVRYEKITPAETTLQDFDKKLLQNGCTYTFVSNAKPSLILTGNNKMFDESVKLISELMKNANISESNYDLLKKRHKKFLIRLYPKKVDADSLSKIYAATFHSLSDVSYYGTRSQSEITDQIINNFGLEKISSSNNIETNTFKFEYNPIFTSVSVSINSKPADKTDKMQLMVLEAYYNTLLWNEVREKRALSYGLLTSMQTPTVNNTPVSLYFHVTTKPGQVFEVAKALTNIAKQMPNDSVVFKKAKQIAYSKLKNSKPHFREVITKVKELKSKGLVKDELLTDLETLDKITFESTNEFFKSKFINRPCNLKIEGGLVKIGKTKLDDFKKEYIK